jgi:peptidyl-prolyl cis-trans isomerase D
LQAAYDRAKRVVMAQMGKNFAFDQKTQARLKEQVTTQLIMDQVLFHEAKKLGFRVSSKQIDAVLFQLPIFQANGQFSATRFQRVLSSMLYSEAGFITDLQKKMIVNQFQAGIVGSSFALPTEINKFVQLIKQTRDIGYMIIPLSHFINQIKISNQDIQKYYQDHKDQFKTKEQVSISYIELSANKLQVKVTPSEMQQFYDDNIDLYSHPERWQVVRVFVALPENADTSTLKKAKNQVIALAKQGKFGKPTWIVHGQVSQSFMVALQKLQPGQISAPISTPQGLFVVKLLQTKKATFDPFVNVTPKVKKALIQQKTEQLFAEQNSKLSDLTYTNSNTLNVAAKELNLPIQTTGLFGKEGRKTGLLANPKIIKAAFSDSVLTQNYNSGPIEINPGQVIVLRVKQHKPAAAKPLAAVKQTVRQQLMTEQAGQKAKALGAQLLAAINQGKAAKNLAAKNGLVWRKFSKVSRDQKNIDPQIIQTAFSSKLSGINLANGNYAIVQVAKVYPGNIKQLSKSELLRLKQAIAQNYGRTDYELYINELMKNANIKKP